MKHTKKLLLLMAMVTTLLLCLAFGASAESYTYGDFTYELTESYYNYDDLATITGYSGTESSVKIPSEIDGCDVAAISENAFKGNQNIVEIIIPSTVIYVDEEAFEGCTALETATIEGDDTFIMTYAFRNCTALNNINIKSDSVHIGGFAFYNTAFWNDESNWENGLLYIDNYLISADSAIVKDKLEISEGTCGIAGAAFQDCVFLTEVIIPEGVSVIGEGCFSYCVALEKVSLPSTLTFIDYAAFSGCASLESINIPKATVYIGEDAFASCFNLKSIEIQNSIAVLEDKSIGYTNYTISDLDRYIEVMQEAILKSNNGEDTTALEEELHSLVNICTEYKEGISIYTCRFGFYSFENAAVTDVLMGIPEINGISGSTAQAYAEESGLDFIATGSEEAVKSDFEYAFNLTYTEIIITGYNGNEENIVIPSEIGGVEVVGIGMKAFSDENTENYLNIKSIKIPDSVTRIGVVAFMECFNLESINIPDSLTNISEGTFYGCFNLIGVEIPASVEKIGEEAFSYCFSLESLEIPENIKSIGTNAFYNCLLLDDVYIYPKDVEINEMAFGYTEMNIDETKVNKKEFIEKYCEAFTYQINGQYDECNAIIAEIQDYFISYDEPLVNEAYTIYGYTDSTAHTYADENEINFIPLDGECKHENTEIRNEKSATCSEEGYTGDTYCKTCDTNIKTGTVIEKLPHTEVIDEAVAPSCKETGLTEGKHCSACGTIIVEQNVVEKLPHTEVVDEAVAPSCKETGLTEGKHCSDCGTVIVEQSVIEKLPHTEVIDKAVAPSCKETGLTEGKHCSDCGTVIVEQSVIEKLPHTEVIDEAVAPSCKETGLTEGKHCSDCGTVIVEQSVIEKLPHTEVIDKAVAPSCKETGLTEGKHCSDCGTVIVEQTVISATGHNFINYKSNNDATCEADGTKSTFCDNGCGVKDTVIDKGSAKGHADANNDGVCDSCGGDVEINDSENKSCSHLCHKSGFMGFIWKILRFFWKLFKINPICSCGMYHY